MLFEIRATLYFDTLTIPEEIKQALLKVWAHAKVVNPCSENQECSVINVLQNHHDDNPHEPCILLWHKDNCPTC